MQLSLPDERTVRAVAAARTALPNLEELSEQLNYDSACLMRSVLNSEIEMPMHHAGAQRAPKQRRCRISNSRQVHIHDGDRMNDRNSIRSAARKRIVVNRMDLKKIFRQTMQGMRVALCDGFTLLKRVFSCARFMSSSLWSGRFTDQAAVRAANRHLKIGNG